jgi:hypothetical protein
LGAVTATDITKSMPAGLTGKYTQDLGGPTLTVIGDYSKLSKRYQEDSDASPYTLFQFFNGSDVNQESLEARLNGGDTKPNWTAGLYGLRIDGKYHEGWQGPAFFTAQEFNNASNPNGGYVPGAWPYGDFKTFWTTGGVPEIWPTSTTASWVSTTRRSTALLRSTRACRAGSKFTPTTSSKVH